MNIVKALEKIAKVIKQRRLSGQITNAELRECDSRLRPLMDQAREWEKTKSLWRKYKTDLSPYITTMRRSIPRINSKTRLIYWHPDTPNTLKVMKLKHGEIHCQTVPVSDFFNFTKKGMKNILMYNASHFYYRWLPRDRKPSHLYDFTHLMNHYTIGGTEPYELVKALSRDYEKDLRAYYQPDIPLDEYDPHILMFLMAERIFGSSRMEK